MSCRSDNLILMDFFIWVGLSAVLWRHPSLPYPLGKGVAFVCDRHMIPQWFSTVQSVSWWVSACSMNFALNILSKVLFADSGCLLLFILPAAYSVLYRVLCRNVLGQLFVYAYARVCTWISVYIHILICVSLHILINDGWEIHSWGCVPLSVLFLEKWEPREELVLRKFSVNGSQIPSQGIQTEIWKAAPSYWNVYIYWTAKRTFQFRAKLLFKRKIFSPVLL